MGLTKIEEIEALEHAVEAFIAQKEAVQAAADLDDHIDDAEREALDNVQRKIDEAKSKLAELRKTFEENKAKWEEKAADYAALQDKAEKLSEFGHSGMLAAAKSVADLKQAVNEQRWADASARLDQAMKDIAADWTDYEAQVAAQATFEPRWAALEKRWNAAKAVAEPSKEARAAMDALEPEIADLYAAVALRDYIKGIEEIKTAKTAMAVVEAALNLPPPANLSGRAWYDANDSKFPKYYALSDLESGFKSNVEAFKKALEDAGVSISISGTKRDPARALVMHYCWMVANGKTAPEGVPAIAGVDIDFDHGDDEVSKAKAAEMVSAYNIVHRPSPNSNHEIGKAIDWTLGWSGDLTIKNKAGEDITITSSPKSGMNTDLHVVGASFGVVKHTTDAPHWSTNGK